MRFKVGDKVRVVRTDDGGAEFVGTVGTITDVDDLWEYPYSIGMTPDTLWREEELEAYVPTPCVDPSTTTRLNEVVTMLEREKRSQAKRIAYRKGLVNRFANTIHVGHYGDGVVSASIEYDNIVARIDAMTKAIAELSK